MQTSILCACVLVLTLSAATPTLQAADPAPEKPIQEQPVKKARGLPFRGTIGSVDTNAQTISLAGKTARTFQITKETRIRRDGNVIPLHEVLIGESVGGYALNDGENIPQVVTLNIRKPKDSEGERTPEK